MLYLLLSAALAAPITWTGVDYELVRLVGDHPHEGQVFPASARQWNLVFLRQTFPGLEARMGVDVGNGTRAHEGLWSDMTAYGHVVEGEHKAIVPNLGLADIELRLKDYPEGRKGMAMTFIADQLNRTDQQACFWVTYYEPASRRLFKADYQCASATGASYDERWIRAQHAVAGKLRNDDIPREVMDPSSKEQLAEAAKRRKAMKARAEAASTSEAVQADLRARSKYTADFDFDEDEIGGEWDDAPVPSRTARSTSGSSTPPAGSSDIPAGWLTIAVAPQGIQALLDAGVEFQQYSAPAASQRYSGPPDAIVDLDGDSRGGFIANIGISSRSGSSSSGSTGGAYGSQPEAECKTAFGETACGYDCKVAFGEVKCASAPGGKCEVAFGEITCSGGSGGSYAGAPEAECETAFGKTACGYDCKVAFGDVKCAGSPGGKCEVAFGEITCSR